MNTTLSLIAYLKQDAQKLFKQLQSPESPGFAPACQRFQQLRSFADVDWNDSAQRSGAQLKHALTVIAVEHGFTSWVELKTALSEVSFPPPECLYPDGGSAFLNQWFRSYREAKQEHEKHGGYLFPYKKQFFICDEEFIKLMGYDPDDSNWRKIGFDFARPKHLKAWLTLCKTR